MYCVAAMYGESTGCWWRMSVRISSNAVMWHHHLTPSALVRQSPTN